MEQNDADLRGVLRKWGDIEPVDGFQTRVRERICDEVRRQKVEIPVTKTLGQEWFLPFAAAAALILAAGVGMFAGGAVGAGGSPMAHPGTLTGAYASMATGAR